MSKIYRVNRSTKIRIFIFSVLASLILIILSPSVLSASVTGVISFKDSLWNDIVLHYPAGSDSAYVEVADSDMNVNGGEIDTLGVLLESEFGDSEWLVLSETEVASGVFRNSIAFDLQVKKFLSSLKDKLPKGRDPESMERRHELIREALELWREDSGELVFAPGDGLFQVSAGDLLLGTYYDELGDWGDPDTVTDQTVYGGVADSVSGTWTKAESPYVIVGDIWINWGDTLTIESGVEVKFMPDVSFRVYGYLDANGIEGDSVYFIPKAEVPEPSDHWGGIYSYYGSSRSELTYVVIRNAHRGYYHSSYDTTLSIISHSRINDCGDSLWGGGGIYVDYGPLTIVNSQIVGNLYYGIEFYYCAQGNVESTEVTENGYYGIYCYNSSVEIEKDSIVGNGQYGIYVSSSYENRLPVVHDCDLYGNDGYDFYNNSAYEIDARHNWWGDSTTAEMNAGGNPKNIEKIYDFFDNPSRGLVNYANWMGKPCPYPEHFVFTDSTGLFYNIVIDSAFLDGLELERCDEIGVFDDTGGGLLCVGASVYHPDSLPIPLTAWKDDPLTPEQDGYTAGDTMHFRVWSRNQDREECASVRDPSGDGRFEHGVFFETWLSAPAPCPGECENIALYSGWQWISTNIDPDPCEMESLFVDCWIGYLDIIIACDGSFCIPGVGCWIPGWNVSEMYRVHMADACTIQVCGTKVLADTPTPLPEGWNCIAYFPECPLEPETALISIWDNLDIVQNDAGQFCIPGIGCWIECMEYNEGYKAHLSSPDTLVYPTSCPPCPPPFAKKNSFPGLAQTTQFNYLGNTGESYSIVVNSVELNGTPIDRGDEIGVFTPSGLCAGAGVWQGDILGIAAWQDDDRTKARDGFKGGEKMVFKLWDKSGNRYVKLSASLEKGDGKFGTGAYALVSLKGVSSQLPEKFALSQNHPNPFNPQTVIQYALPHDCEVQITIYNILGQKVRTLVDEHQDAGYKRVKWDSRNERGEEIASGIYFYKIQAGEFTQSKKMVILK
ncbi:MAG: right-handed parallel beta-helix repeat-containing protein [candidate division Zixibacteria bacterium]|nr:right-handed parallel beta-helix repeat-containing protein [candidate division Zixibacteria bacterium]